MSRKGRPQDNAYVESFFKTLKTEEVECNEYESLAEAQAEIGAYIERGWGIHLTQVTPRCSMWLRGGLPARFA